MIQPCACRGCQATSKCSLTAPAGEQPGDDRPGEGSRDQTVDLVMALAAAAPFDFVAETVGGAVAEKLLAHMQRDGVLGSIAVLMNLRPRSVAISMPMAMSMVAIFSCGNAIRR